MWNLRFEKRFFLTWGPGCCRFSSQRIFLANIFLVIFLVPTEPSSMSCTVSGFNVCVMNWLKRPFLSVTAFVIKMRWGLGRNYSTLLLLQTQPCPQQSPEDLHSGPHPWVLSETLPSEWRLECDRRKRFSRHTHLWTCSRRILLTRCAALTLPGSDLLSLSRGLLPLDHVVARIAG